MRGRILTLGCLVTLLVLCGGLPVPFCEATEQSANTPSSDGLKGVFVGTESGDTHGGSVGRLGVQLIRNGIPQLVRLDNPFRSGDKFRFEVSANRDGWLYVFHKPPTGEPKLLWPRRSEYDSAKYLDDHAVRAKQTYVIPASPKVFVFDKEVGAETFYVAITSEKTSPRLTAQGIKEGKLQPVPRKDAGGNQIVQFRVKNIDVPGQAGYIGLKYLPSQQEKDPYVYFSAHPQEGKDLTMIEFKLQHE